MKKKYLIIQLVCFLLILAGGSGALIYGICEGRDVSELEKRELAEFPEPSLEGVLNGEFEAGLDKALSDHIAGRDMFVTARTAALVLLGKREFDGIFIDGDRLIETYGDADFDDKQIEQNIDYLTDFMVKMAASIGSENVKLMLVPGKNTIYCDRLPEYMMQSGRSDALLEKIKTSLAVKLGENERTAGTENKTGDMSVGSDDDREGATEPVSDGSDVGSGENVGSDDDREGATEPVSDGSDVGNEDDADYSDEDEDIDFGELIDFDELSSPDNSEDDQTPDMSSDTSADRDENVQKPGQNQIEIADNMLIDIKGTLFDHRDEYIYYLTDHHWTSPGARYAYIEYILKTQNSDHSAEKTESSVVTNSFLGTDYNRIHYYKKMDNIIKYNNEYSDAATCEIDDSGEIYKKAAIYDETALETSDKYNYFFGGNYSRITVESPETVNSKEAGNTNEKKGTLLLIKDSFANALVPMLCENLSKIIMIDPRYVNSSVSDYLEELPDEVLIIYNEEKFMQDTHQGYLGAG